MPPGALVCCLMSSLPFSVSPVACGKARSAGNGVSHCPGTQRGHGPQGPRPTGAGLKRHCGVAVLGNTGVFPAGGALH